MPPTALRTATLALLLAACSDTDPGAIGPSGDAPLGADGAVGDTTFADTAPSADATAEGDALADAITPADAAATDAATGTDVTTPGFCVPGTRICESLLAWQMCNAEGTAFSEPVPCGAEESCRAGSCNVRCPNDPKFGAYVGCEFWATDLPNYPDPTLNPTPENLPWALVVSNPSTNEIRVGFEMPPLFTYTPPDDVVPPNDSRVFLLPNINVQGTSLRPKGVHLTATGPVLVHQFNPWDNTFSNDATLLLPDPLLGDEYVILSWPTSPLELAPLISAPNQNGYFTVIAVYDNTNVTFQVSAPVRASGPIPALTPGQLHTVRLKRGDVLSVQADPETLFQNADISGSRVTADKPIAVFGGHEEAVVGDPVYDPNTNETSGPCCADHLEAQMLPASLLGTRYFAAKSPPRGTTEIEDDFWRIQTLEAGVTIQTNPPQAGAHNVTLAQIGDFVQVKSSGSFEITASGKVQVGQYLVSRDVTQGFTGDPSLTVLVPADRYRRDYVVTLPPAYSKLWLTVVKPSGATVSVDAVPVPASAFTPLGATGYEVAYVAGTAGLHVVSSDQRFGLTVYGYNNAVSFAYIGGIAGPGE